LWLDSITASALFQKHAKPVRNDNIKPLDIFLRVYDGFLSVPATNGVSDPLNGVVVLCEETIHRLAANFAAGKIKQIRRDSIKTIEFGAPLVVRSVSDVTNSSTSDKSDAQRPRIFSTDF